MQLDFEKESVLKNNKKRIEELAKIKKIELQQAFIKNMSLKSNENNQTVSKNSEVDFKTMYKKEKRKNSKLISEIKKIKKERSELRIEAEALKRKLADAGEMKRAFAQIDERHNNAIKELNDIIKTKQQELEILKEEVNNITTLSKESSKVADLYFKKSVKLSRDLKSLSGENKTHINQLKLLAKENIELKEDIHNKSKNAYKLYARISQLTNDIMNIKVLDVDTTLDYLNKDMTWNNYNLYKKVVPMFRKFKKISATIQSLRDIEENEKKIMLFGIVVNDSDDDKYIFRDVENKPYPAIKVPGKPLDGCPATAFLNRDGSVTITKTFDTVEERNALHREMKSNLVKKDSESDEIVNDLFFEKLQGVKVLIVTSLNGVKYVQKLEKYEVKAKWIDPFEKSPLHVRREIDSSDIVLLCVENMPHSVLDQFTDTTEKIQYLTHHNEEIVFSRVRYAAIQLGLVKILS